MRVLVWVDAWQLQCCGDEFRLGSEVSWSVARTGGPDSWIDLVLGREWASRVIFHEEHHQEDDAQTEPLRGSVTSIQEVRCRRVPQPRGTGTVLVPAPASGRLTKVDHADPWASESLDDKQDPVTFDGWIVEVDVTASD